MEMARLTRKNNIQLVIFDCDGVLVDSERMSANTLIRLLGRIGLDIDLAYVQKYFMGRSWPKVAAEIRSQHGLDLDSRFEDRYREELLAEFERGLRTVEGVEAVLERLAVKYCVATSSSPKRARRSLELAGLDTYFGDRLFTSSQVANGKPAPDLFLFTAQSMQIPVQECLVIEDSIPGIFAAKAAGMEVWRFTGGSHLKGAADAMPDDLSGIKVFDNWSQFFEIAPELRLRPEKLLQSDEQQT